MEGTVFTDCTIDVVRDESQEAYVFYVDCDGIPVEFMRRKLGDLDDARREQQQQQQQPGNQQ